MVRYPYSRDGIVRRNLGCYWQFFPSISYYYAELLRGKGRRGKLSFRFFCSRPSDFSARFFVRGVSCLSFAPEPLKSLYGSVYVAYRTSRLVYISHKALGSRLANKENKYVANNMGINSNCMLLLLLPKVAMPNTAPNLIPFTTHNQGREAHAISPLVTCPSVIILILDS